MRNRPASIRGDRSAEHPRIVDKRIHRAKFADLPGNVQGLGLRGEVSRDDHDGWKALPKGGSAIGIACMEDNVVPRRQ